MNTIRTIEIEVTGEEECEYRDWEEMRGLLTSATKLFSGKGVQDGFTGWAEGLKKEAESRKTANAS